MLGCRCVLLVVVWSFVPLTTLLGQSGIRGCHDATHQGMGNGSSFGGVMMAFENELSMPSRPDLARKRDARYHGAIFA